METHSLEVGFGAGWESRKETAYAANEGALQEFSVGSFDHCSFGLRMNIIVLLFILYNWYTFHSQLCIGKYLFYRKQYKADN